VHFEKIWSEYRARIRTFLQSRISNSADVDDLLQDISIKVFRGLSTIKSSQKIQPWLFQTAHLTIIDFYRKSAKERRFNSDDAWYTEDDPQTYNELERCVEPFLQALSPEMAEMLLAIDIEGVSQKEYARTKGLAYSTMKSRVQKARSNLRALFEDCCLMSFDANGNIIDYHSKSDICEKC